MKKILVVDDEKAQLDLAEVTLKELGFDVITASNGKDCLNIAEREKPDLILLDVVMPELDGGRTADLLLDIPETKDIPIIFLTSIVTEEEEVESRGKIGGRTFVAKPFDRERLLAAINKALKG